MLRPVGRRERTTSTDMAPVLTGRGSILVCSCRTCIIAFPYTMSSHLNTTVNTAESNTTCRVVIANATTSP
uniref:Uncharacterized protein n=1 Tax=Ascaris lumbricoides TaxID=6252 RepID=A0A0M3HG16_ASCLU